MFILQKQLTSSIFGSSQLPSLFNEFTLQLFDLRESSAGIEIFRPIGLSASLIKLPNPKTCLK